MPVSRNYRRSHPYKAEIEWEHPRVGVWVTFEFYFTTRFEPEYGDSFDFDESLFEAVEIRLSDVSEDWIDPGDKHAKAITQDLCEWLEKQSHRDEFYARCNEACVAVMDQEEAVA